MILIVNIDEYMDYKIVRLNTNKIISIKILKNLVH